jgi:ketosteroid isomerase-like protein
VHQNSVPAAQVKLAQEYKKEKLSMRILKVSGLKRDVLVSTVLAVAVFLLFQLPGCSVGRNETAKETPLPDRIVIEDMLTEYYVDLAAGKSHDLAQYYTEDAVFDVNGMVSQGRDAIEKLYKSVGAGQSAQKGRMHMLLNNPIIKITGDTATAWMIWTGVANDDVKAPPRLVEQGREFDELVKKDGRWFIKKRFITADSGLPELWQGTYKPREFR